MKKVLSICYSQTGQLDEILSNFLQPFEQCIVDVVSIKPNKAFPFPWNSANFFDIMPETVLEEPIELASFSLKYDEYDLIIIGYQPWFLSPSLPMTALLQNEEFRTLMKGKPVVTVIGARNMWLNSQKSVVREIESAGGYLVANVPYIDRVQNHVSALTILHWMSKGTKTRRWGFLPLPGVSDKDIHEAGKYAIPIAEAVQTGTYSGLQNKVLQIGGINIRPSIMLIEERAKRLFNIWANTIKKKGTTPEKRAKWIKRFEWYLITALFVVSPPILLVNLILRPVLWLTIQRKRKNYLFYGIKPLYS